MSAHPYLYQSDGGVMGLMIEPMFWWMGYSHINTNDDVVGFSPVSESCTVSGADGPYALMMEIIPVVEDFL